MVSIFTKFTKTIIRASGGVFFISSLVKKSITSLISCLTLKLFLNLLMYNRNMFGFLDSLRPSSAISDIVRRRSCGLPTIFGESSEISESGRKTSGNRQKRRYQYVCIINKVIHS